MPERKSPASRASGSGRRPGSTGATSSRRVTRPRAGNAGSSTGAAKPPADAEPKADAQSKADAQFKADAQPKVDTTKAPAEAEAATAKSPASARTGGKTTGSKAATSKTTGAKTTTSKTTTSKTTGAKAAGSKSASSKTAASKAAARPAGSKPSSGKPANRGPAQKRPARKKKSIVNQKQRPWGLIISAIVVVAFAAAVVGVVVATHKSGSSGTTTKGGQAVSSGDPYRQAELPAAAAIKGVAYRVEGQHTHVEGHIKYDSSPPVGGDHSQYWADCTGTVYPKAIANENAVHMLEHGAIWITYNKSKLSAAQVSTLAKNVSGIDRMAMSPYPNLKSPISLQAWGYQLFLNSPTDPRIAQFIKALKYNQKTTPEYGATCSQPTFKSTPSTYGNPLWEPKGGSSGNVGGL